MATPETANPRPTGQLRWTIRIYESRHPSLYELLQPKGSAGRSESLIFCAERELARDSRASVPVDSGLAQHLAVLSSSLENLAHAVAAGNSLMVNLASAGRVIHADTTPPIKTSKISDQVAEAADEVLSAFWPST